MYPVVAGPIPEVRPPEVRSRAWAVAAASPKVEEVGRAGKAVAFPEEAVDKALESRLDSDLERCNSLHL